MTTGIGKWEYSGVSLQPDITVAVMAIFNIFNRTVTPYLRFTKFTFLNPSEIEILKEVGYRAGYSIYYFDIKFKSTPLEHLGFNDTSSSVINDQILAVEPPIPTEAGMLMDFVAAYQCALAYRIDSNTLKRVTLVNHVGQVATDDDTNFQILFHLDGGYLGQAKTICPVMSSTVSGTTLRDNVSGTMCDPFEFFQIPLLKNRWTETVTLIEHLRNNN